VSGKVRAPGFYPDPWGTPDERYFDGVAWARTTRRADGLQTPPDPSSTVTNAPPPPPPPPPVPDPPDDPGSTVPPGWHPDPWGAAGLRYWDGRQWTGHVSGMPGGSPPALQLSEERTASRWARLGLAFAGPALGVSTIAGAFQWSWISDHWDELTRKGSSFNQSGNQGAAVLSQLAGIAILVAGVLFLLWFYRSASLAASAGLRARRKPGLATASFIIPILNLWWPYQSTCDLLPEAHPARHLVLRWWLLWIACFVGGLAVIASAFQSTIALAITTAATVVLALLAAVTARVVVGEIADAHDQLLAGA
jgi:hypothetical protein